MATVAPVVNGQVQISESSQQTERKTGSELDKQDFLMLLVTQMQYQDPLQPTENTEYVSQLAQFTELEEMENLNNTATNKSAFDIVGKVVYIEETSTIGESKTVEGVVDYVIMKNGDPYLSVNGAEYSYSDVVQVIDTQYLISQYIPSVASQTVNYRHQDPQDVVITGIDMGENGYEATGMGIVLVDSKGGTTAIKAEYMKYADGTLTIDKKAFESVNAGTYTVAFAFDDANSTVDYESVTLVVKGIIKEDTSSDSDNNTEDSGGSNETV